MTPSYRKSKLHKIYAVKLVIFCIKFLGQKGSLTVGKSKKSMSFDFEFDFESKSKS